MPGTITTAEVGGCPLLFYVEDARGATVVPTGGDWICVAIARRLVLPPGREETASFTWDTSSFTRGVYWIYATFSGGGTRLATPRAAILLI